MKRDSFHFIDRNTCIDTGATFSCLRVHEYLYDRIGKCNRDIISVENATLADGENSKTIILHPTSSAPIQIYIDRHVRQCSKILIFKQHYTEGWQVSAANRTCSLIGREDMLDYDSNIQRTDYGITTLEIAVAQENTFPGKQKFDTRTIKLDEEEEEDTQGYQDHESDDEGSEGEYPDDENENDVDILRGLFQWHLSEDKQYWTWICSTSLTFDDFEEDSPSDRSKLYLPFYWLAAIAVVIVAHFLMYYLR